MIAKVVFDILNFPWSWCIMIKNMACYIIMFILFVQCIGISIYGKMIYNILSKSQMQMQMMILNSPFQPKIYSNSTILNKNSIFSPNHSMDDFNIKFNGNPNTNATLDRKDLFINKPKDRVSMLTISG